MSPLTTNPAQRPVLENACRDTVESILNLPGILGAGVALYDTEGALRVDYTKRRDNQPSPLDRIRLDVKT